MIPLLDGIISPTQSALIAFECMHSLNTLRDSRGEYCTYKLDLAKAYDCVDWKFLEKMLQAYGFAPIWINWIMTCVTTVKFSMHFNGQLLESFHPSRGLRQGDPLSPYLFLFVAEALSLLINDAAARGIIQEFPLNKHAPRISHLLFADDSLLFQGKLGASSKN